MIEDGLIKEFGCGYRVGNNSLLSFNSPFGGKLLFYEDRIILKYIRFVEEEKLVFPKKNVQKIDDATLGFRIFHSIPNYPSFVVINPFNNNTEVFDMFKKYGFINDDVQPKVKSVEPTNQESNLLQKLLWYLIIGIGGLAVLWIIILLIPFVILTIQIINRNIN